MTKLTLDQFCDLYEDYQGKFTKKETINLELVENIISHYLEWAILEETEEYNDCINDGIFSLDSIAKMISSFPKNLGILYFKVGDVDNCVEMLQKAEQDSEVTLYLGLAFMLQENFRRSSDVFLKGEHDQLSSICNYFLGITDKFTERKFSNREYLDSCFENLEIVVLQDKSKVVFTGDSEQGLLLRRNLAIFTKFIAPKKSLLEIAKATEKDYEWTLEIAKINKILA
eukprot:NODE_51_length_31136_cov_0.357670.p17 type:complete len:228 gc:universal NODE_51_length_31136_cov_0.357670:21109-20426(-)